MLHVLRQRYGASLVHTFAGRHLIVINPMRQLASSYSDKVWYNVQGCVDVCTYMYMYVFVCMCLYVYTFMSLSYVCVHTCVCMYMVSTDSLQCFLTQVLHL